MANVTCAKCRDIVSNKEYLKCSSCNKTFHVNCTSVSCVRFYNTMKKHHKDKWQCDTCRQNKNKINMDSQQPSISALDNTLTENVTLRQKIIVNVPTENSFSSLEDEDINATNDENDYTGASDINIRNVTNFTESEYNSMLINTDNTILSLPNLSIDDQEKNELKIKIEQLNEELEKEREDFQNLYIENQELLKIIQSKDRSIETLKTLLNADKQRSEKSCLLTPIKLNGSTNSIPSSSLRKTMIKKLLFETKEKESFENNDANQHIICNKNENEKLKASKNTDSNQINLCRQHTNIDLINEPRTHDRVLSENDFVEKNEATDTCITKNRIFIIGDEQGKGVNYKLRQELGHRYDIFSCIKPGAQIDTLLETTMNNTYSDVNENDYVLILAGTNDNNPMKLNAMLYFYLNRLYKKTNVIICETSANKFLNVNQVNKAIKSVVAQFTGVHFIDLRYSYLGKPRHNARHISQNVLREIYRIEYSHKLEHHIKHVVLKTESLLTPTPTVTTATIGTQTDMNFLNHSFRGELSAE